MAATHNSAQRLMLRHPRSSGAVLLALGSFILYTSVVSPIRDAHAGVERVEISTEGTGVGLALSIFGLTYALFGARFAPLFQPGSNQSKLPAYAFGIVMASLGLAGFYALKSYIASQGYVFQSGQ